MSAKRTACAWNQLITKWARVWVSGAAGVVSKSGAAQRCRAHVGGLRADPGDDGEQELAQPLVVALQHLDHVRRGHGLLAGGADVVVRDHCDRRVTELQLAREVALGVGGHVDRVPPCGLEPQRLRARREAGPLDDDHRPAVPNRYTPLPCRLDEQPAEVAAKRVGGGDVRRLGAVVEGVGTAARPVDVLVADDEVADLEVAGERARRAWADDPAHSRLAHRPDVGAERDAVGRELVGPAMPGNERHALAADVSDSNRGRGLPVRRVDLELLNVIEERVEPGPAEDPDHSVAEVSETAVAYASCMFAVT